MRVDNGDEMVTPWSGEIEVPLPQVVPAGPNVLAIMAWLFEKTVAPTLEAKQRRKKALKAVRQKEQEYEAQWDALKPTEKK